MRNHLLSVIILVDVTPEMTKPMQPAVAPEIGRDEQPDERDNEIVIELDRENQYGRTQPRANEPQGNHSHNIDFHSLSLHADSINIEAKDFVHYTRSAPNNSLLMVLYLFFEVTSLLCLQLICSIGAQHQSLVSQPITRCS